LFVCSGARTFNVTAETPTADAQPAAAAAGAALAVHANGVQKAPVTVAVSPFCTLWATTVVVGEAAPSQ
jgi:hypothetical protein